ncbi:hypothetical protein XA68_14009 [Ophiocordyceps unilateralis]|uniref:Putative transcription factor kapC n=1 Tax=Ophiocordyceps unilateralis TaxID=268505 RepID=A0A2A9PBG0_OPHUN|nr:hypothetical protein XA68_14009 [Ophiocordyceps unilateralis]
MYCISSLSYKSFYPLLSPYIPFLITWYKTFLDFIHLILSSTPSRPPSTNTLPSQRRRAQNRASQRAYRERKEQRIRDLEQQVRDLEQRQQSLIQAYESLQLDYSRLRAGLDHNDAEYQLHSAEHDTDRYRHTNPDYRGQTDLSPQPMQHYIRQSHHPPPHLTPAVPPLESGFHLPIDMSAFSSSHSM